VMLFWYGHKFQDFSKIILTNIDCRFFEKFVNPIPILFLIS
jgi:hypothetical protein